MNANKFTIQVCGIFLSITISNSISKIVSNFSIFSLVVFLLTLFLSINFFFAKFQQLNEPNYKMSSFIFALNILTLACFAFMPFLMMSFLGIMCTQLALRFFDVLLIFAHNEWKRSNIDKQEIGWLKFDISYFVIELSLVIVYLCLRHFEIYDVSLIFIIFYLCMAIFESLFDFLKHRMQYGLQEEKKDEEQQ